MNARKKKALAAAGWVSGDAEDYLELSAEERCLVELRLAVSQAMHYRRKQGNLTQQDVAKKLGTSQSRVARMEAASSDVSLDSLFTGLFALGGSMKDLAGGPPSGNVLPPSTPSTRGVKYRIKGTVKAKSTARDSGIYRMVETAKGKAMKTGSSARAARGGKLFPKK